MSALLNRTCAPNGPDLNPVNTPFGALQEQDYYGRKFDTVDQFKQAIALE